MPLQVGCPVQYKNTWYIRTECKIVGPEDYRLGLIMGPNITCRALVLKTADPAQSMYIGNLSKQMWALITYIGPRPEVLLSDRPTIYNHASRGQAAENFLQNKVEGIKSQYSITCGEPKHRSNCKKWFNLSNNITISEDVFTHLSQKLTYPDERHFGSSVRSYQYE